MRLLYTLLLFFPLLALAQGQRFHVSGQIFSSGADSVYLAQQFGSTFKNYAASPLDAKGRFELKGILAGPDYYILRVGQQNLNLVLRDTSHIQVFGDGRNLLQFCNFVNSEESRQMHEYIVLNNDWRSKADSALLAIKTDPSKEAEINSYMTQAYSQFQTALQSYVGMYANSAALILPLSSMQIDQDFASYEKLMLPLYQSFGQSTIVQNLYKQYLAKKQEREAADPFARGKLVPDFEELRTDGKKKMKLSDLKGQVILLDFWASWCGPCRAENPNVVKNYQKYKDAGFTVMSVSLDSNKDKWLAAIAADQLAWPNHVSDLGGWQSKVAQLYGVQSIPFTVLLDKEGRVIATNLRGAALEQALQQIFGF
ncbi:MAG: TlpA family protein disulfide reductase [Crocinitomicaceae bacterium]|jgi:thiol-disulfide isomerase/thioredoxin|nr:TlpA family protein disulfide reductase [Crocinitomicaceae bacterium]MDP4723498.1 TlpA family protein disulfide reductase [Crocinitomicaceae bacterium]MDP4738616.1 TlpA family protein disulfide reductase [Crocinitomicaceae bacterium]MDP4798629.1 TlpA family protein disulfide reductase [Crocinitomicaceae bacterium]MDP4805654.1 TlpA family protein disulfide reductase [Crocinitomicaceae bacterium]